MLRFLFKVTLPHPPLHLFWLSVFVRKSTFKKSDILNLALTSLFLQWLCILEMLVDALDKPYGG